MTDHGPMKPRPDHDFRGKPMTPEEFKADLNRVIGLFHTAKRWDELPYALKYGLMGLEGKFDLMMEGLRKA